MNIVSECLFEGCTGAKGGLFTLIIIITTLLIFIPLWWVGYILHNRRKPGMTPKSESKAYQNKSSKKDKKQIICIVCKSNITGKSALERVGKGSAGATAGFATGGWFGSAILPVIGTAIGAAYGAYAGGSLGSMQVDSICQNCCSTCKNPKQNCICRYDRYAYDEEDGDDL